MSLGLWKLLVPVLDFIQSFTNSYAISIIIITLLIKLIVVPLDIKQRRSMLQMQLIKPKLDAIAQKYANDPDKRSQKQMELYQKEKISPFSGCLPMLLMMVPLFILFNLLRNVAGQQLLDAYNMIVANDVAGLTQFMENAKFLWIQNIWQADTFFGNAASALPSVYTTVQSYPQFAEITEEMFNAVMINHEGLSQEMIALLDNYVGSTAKTNGWFILPLLAGGTQYLYTLITQKLNGSDAMTEQNASFQKVMTYGFPIMTVWICSTSSASFALYWLASNLFMMVTQFILSRVNLTAKGVKKK